MIPLSVAITRGTSRAEASADALECAYWGALRESALQPSHELCTWMSRESLCDYKLRELYRYFPHLGQSVRLWPRFTRMLEDERWLPRARPNQTQYRREIHRSLFQVLTDLDVRYGSHALSVATLLEQHGL
ncbi:MAG: hypothetical protein ACYDBH_00330 [Acidobacteriaceae bacterium]